MKEVKKKIIVAHPGKQHSYKLANALEKEEVLFAYITTVYNKPGSITNFLGKILNKKYSNKILKKENNFINHTKIIQFGEIYGILLLILARLDKRKFVYNFVDYRVKSYFGKKVANYAIKNKVDAVVMYDTTGAKCFEILEKKAPEIKRILDMAGANRLYMKQIYEEDMNRLPQFSDKLYKERKILWDKKINRSIETELKLAQYFLVPSSFVEDSLIYSNINRNKIFICRYGANFSISENPKKVDVQNSKLNIIYVGNITQMKGVFYLLEAIKQLNDKDINVKLVGNYDNISGIFDEYKGFCDFLGYIEHKELSELYKQADLMVFPSLGDSFGLVVLEAMSFGVPVICSENTGAKDIILNEQNGYIIPTGDKDVIMESILKIKTNRDLLSNLSKNCYKTAKQYSWENYDIQVSQAFKNILNDLN